MTKQIKNFLQISIANSWKKIAPFWSLKHAVAVNPLAGLEDLSFKDALVETQTYFQQKDMPQEMYEVNRQTIKWLQVFFDEGQSVITMPLRYEGLLTSVLHLLRFDTQVNFTDNKTREWFEKLSSDPKKVITECLHYLDISQDQYEQFLTLLLTTLPGWAAYITYRVDWDLVRDENRKNPVTKEEYLALRLVLVCVLWPDAKSLLSWHASKAKKANSQQLHAQVRQNEKKYTHELLNKLVNQAGVKNNKAVDAQFMFCIDVRSEPFRCALEAQGNYETFGIAGFFGLPVNITNAVTGKFYTSCPVLITPVHTVVEKSKTSFKNCIANYRRLQSIKRIYHSVKYTFTTPLVLVENIGFVTGLWMACKTFFPRFAVVIKKTIQKVSNSLCRVEPLVESIPFEQQVAYALDALQMIGLTKNFASLVFLCGHKSITENNPHASLLDCGACGGNPGGQNARILAKILNNTNVRLALQEKHILIPERTVFIAAEHNTTTDKVELYGCKNIPERLQQQLERVKTALEGARVSNAIWRSGTLGDAKTSDDAIQNTQVRSQDWAQTRPEWGLARNASFIIAPRWFTQNIDLEGRSFLHSYSWKDDQDGIVLAKILTAPVVVAQWINMQYFFSTLDVVAFGAGSKVTNNITGKIGVMQGNASDLMTGLPLQSVYTTDTKAYHELVRLTVVVYAPQNRIDQIVAKHFVLQQLFGNEWMHVICIDPESNQKFRLQKDFLWEKIG